MVTTRVLAVLAGLALGAATVLAIPAPAGAEDTTFSSTGGLTAPAFTTATPYPSAITVAGTGAPITGVQVSLNGISSGGFVHTVIALVAPNGDSLLLLGKVGGTNPTTGVNLVLSDNASSFASTGPVSSGAYKPTANSAAPNFAAPGPGTNYQKPGPNAGNTATLASVFGGDAADGTWKLFVKNDGGDFSITGWSLTISTARVPPPPAPDTTLTKTPKKKINTTKHKAKVSFSFSSASAGATFECSIDAKAFAACTSATSFKAKIGKHTFAVRAVASGQTDPTPATYGFKVKRKH